MSRSVSPGIFRDYLILGMVDFLGSFDSYYYTKEFSPATSYWSGELWKERLQRIVSDKSPENVDHFIGATVRGALNELAAELNSKGINAEIKFQDMPADVSLTIHHKQIEDFVYGVRNQDRLISNVLVRERNVPTVNRNQANFPMSYFGDNRLSYNVAYFTQREIIADVLKQYERFLELSSEIKNEIFTDIASKRRS